MEVLSFEGTGKGKGERIIDSLGEALVTLPIPGEILPNRLDSHVPEDGIGLVTNNVYLPNKRDIPRSGVGGLRVRTLGVLLGMGVDPSRPSSSSLAPW